MTPLLLVALIVLGILAVLSAVLLAFTYTMARRLLRPIRSPRKCLPADVGLEMEPVRIPGPRSHVRGADRHAEQSRDNRAGVRQWRAAHACTAGSRDWRCGMSESANDPAPQTPKTRVVHVNRDEYDIYIGRDIPARGFSNQGWGNPFRVHLGRRGVTVADVIARYREWVQTQPQLMKRLPELRGKRLGCWCAPKGGLPGNLYGHTCHGEVLAALADGLDNAPGDEAHTGGA